MSSTLTLDDRREIVAWMKDRVQAIRAANKLAASLPKAQQHPTDADVGARLAYLAAGHFNIRDAKGLATVADTAKAVANLPEMHTAFIQTETFRLSREDLLDIAHWAERTDGYPASAIQVSAFLRAVVRGNLAELRKDRVPAPIKKKLVIKRKS